jgi:hypothetical protein
VKLPLYQSVSPQGLGLTELTVSKSVKDIAKPVQPLGSSTCAVCLDDFGIRRVATVAWKVVCEHVFHAKCLADMVNGIDQNSNCCPLCRVEVCVARERRRIVCEDISDGEDEDGE